MRRQEWQDEAWAYFDDVPEIKYSVWYEGNVMAKARWFVGVRDPDDPEADPIPVSDPKAKIDKKVAEAAMAQLRRLTGPLGGISEIVRELNMNLEIAAEAYLVGFGARTITVDGEEISSLEEWDIKSVSEVDQQSGTVKIKRGPNDNKPRELDPEFDTIIRIWQRHPRWSMLPDCNMRGVLSECEGLVILSNLVKAEAKSRMNAGYVTLPNELGQGPESDETEGEDGADAQNDPLMEELYAGATDPVEDPTSAAAVAPTFIRGPAEYLQDKYLRHISIARDLTDVLEQRIEARVQRIARGLNLPVEVVMGHQETTFTNAQQIEEDIFTKHFQPRLVLIADALTVGFLHPNLLDEPDNAGPGDAAAGSGFAPDVVEPLVVWFDPIDMVKQADPLQSVTEGVNLNLVGGEAWRRISGFSEDDAPTPEEILIRSVLHLRTFDPGISTAILELLGVDLNIPTELPGTASASTPSNSNEAAAAMLAVAVQAKRNGQPLDTDALLKSVIPMLAPAPLEVASTSTSLPTARQIERNVGYDLMLIDRDLRARLVTAASSSMTRALERVGNRLRSRLPASMRNSVDAWHVAERLGQRFVAAAGFVDDDLVSDDAWDALEEQFMQWGSQAQSQALAAVKKLVGMTPEAEAEYGQRQVTDLAEAWTWAKDALHDLAVARIYEVNPDAPDVGEFDPTARVPTGLIRQALARAGGAQGLSVTDNGNPYVVVNNGEPPGGIATGQLVKGALTDAGAAVEAYEWVYGPAFRKTPFEEHLDLDGEIFTTFDSDVLVAGDWIGDYYFPGDHEGCACDIAPTIVAPEDLEEGE